MGISNKHDEWEDEYYNIVKRSIPFKKYRLGQSNQFTYTTSCPLDTEDIVISYNKQFQVFLVWNAILHKYIDSGKRHQFSLGKTNINILKKDFDIITKNGVYIFNKKLESGVEESVFIVTKNAFLDFCSNYQKYVFYSENQNIEHLDLETQNNIYRDYINTLIPKRDPNFRSKILNKFHHTCIVCGAKDDVILQAAHIESVKDGGFDIESNGYCLCANHHLLFDNKKINIDLEKGAFNYTEDIDEPWKKEAKKRNFKLFLPNKQEEK